MNNNEIKQYSKDLWHYDLALDAIEVALKHIDNDQFILIVNPFQKFHAAVIQQAFEEKYKNHHRFIYRIDKNLNDVEWFLSDANGNKIFYSKGDNSGIN